MNPFFIPEQHDGEAEATYEALRASAEAETGMVAHKRRIASVACRRKGADTTIAVGDSEAIDGQTVLAILQVGRELFTVHCADATGAPSTIQLARRTVYSVTDFD